MRHECLVTRLCDDIVEDVLRKLEDFVRLWIVIGLIAPNVTLRGVCDEAISSGKFPIPMQVRRLEGNNLPELRRIFVCLQGVVTGA